jgi:hypothetical protein
MMEGSGSGGGIGGGRRPFVPHRGWVCRHPGCGLVLGFLRPAAYGGKYLQLDEAGAQAVEPAAGDGRAWVIRCKAGHVTIWRGGSIKWRRCA